MSSLAGSWTGNNKTVLKIIKAIEERHPREHHMIMATFLAYNHTSNAAEIELNDPTITPEGTQNPKPPSNGAPFLSADIGQNLPPMLSVQDPMTPMPGGGIMTTTTNIRRYLKSILMVHKFLPKYHPPVCV